MQDNCCPAKIHKRERVGIKYMEVTVRKTDDYKARHRNDVKICVRVVDFCVNILSRVTF